MHYSTIIFEENQWNKYAHSIVGHISQEAFEKIDTFFKVAQRIREQQIYIKQKIQLSMDNRVFTIITLSITKQLLQIILHNVSN